MEEIIMSTKAESVPITDMGLAGWLRLNGVKFIDFEPNTINSWQGEFLFEDTPEIQDLIKDYYDDGLGQCKSYYSTLRDLRGIIAQKKRANGRKHQ